MTFNSFSIIFINFHALLAIVRASNASSSPYISHGVRPLVGSPYVALPCSGANLLAISASSLANSLNSGFKCWIISSSSCDGSWLQLGILYSAITALAAFSAHSWDDATVLL